MPWEESLLEGNSKAMFELSQSMEWTRLEQTLQIDQLALLAIPIPDELVYEKDHQSMKNYVVNKFVNFLKLFK